jgi:hypothetical protein
MRIADAVVDILRSEGVKFVAALPGDDILPLFDAFHQQNDIPLILTRHEQATVFMADGYAQLRRQCHRRWLFRFDWNGNRNCGTQRHPDLDRNLEQRKSRC